MRLTREMLFKIAQDTVAQRARADRSIVGVYLHGSMLGSEPLLGGVADIDLFFVHNDEVAVEREIVRLTDEVHLDMAHHHKKDYRHAREFRVHPWMSHTLYSCKILYDPQHFLDFVQASVRGQFARPDHVIQRARPQAEQARQIWTSLRLGAAAAEVQDVISYLKALEAAANAISLLSGSALVERRFLVQFAERARLAGQPGLYAGLLGLLHGVAEIDAELLSAWLFRWDEAFSAVSQNNPPARFNPARRYYYTHALEAWLSGDQFQNALWPLLNTWPRLVSRLPADSEAYRAWRQAYTHLGLVGGVFSERLDALDAYLDTVEEMLDRWANENGA